MIHYHGTPITPRKELLNLAGKNFCVSYADARDADVCLSIGQSVLWDNGAFSFFTKNTATRWSEYYEWLETRLGHPHWAIPPDVIDGPIEQQRELLQKWPHPKELSGPVWHLGLSLDWLAELSDEWPRICFGSSGQYWQVGSESWQRRVDSAFNVLAKRHQVLPWVHMLRGLALGGERWPFASADSTNVARNYKDTRANPEWMARKIDGVQCPIKWTPVAEQSCFLENLTKKDPPKKDGP